MDKEALKALIASTKGKIEEFENTIFKERTSEYSLYRAETSIYLDTIKFLEGIVEYELNADEIESIKTNLTDISKVLDDDLAKLNMKSEVISTEKEPNEFNAINFDTISEEVNNTSADYNSINNFLDNNVPA